MKSTRQTQQLTLLPIFIFCIALNACNNKETAVASERAPYQIPDSILKTLVIDTVKMDNLTVSLKFNGIIDTDPDKVSNVFPLISGNVQPSNVQIGDFVRKGQVLGSIKSPEMAGYAAGVASADANIRFNEQQLARTKDMAKAGLATQLDVTQAEVSYKQALVAKEQAQKVLGINGNNAQGNYNIISPIDGFITQKNVTGGMAIRTDNGNPLYTIADINNVWVMANVYEANIGKVHQGDAAAVTTITYPDKVFYGKVDKLMNTLDPANRVMKMRIVLPNPGYILKPQMFATVTINNKLNQQAIAVPASALVFDNSQYYVIVYTNPKTVAIRQVELLGSNSSTAWIKSGVNPGEQVIASNAILIYGALNN